MSEFLWVKGRGPGDCYTVCGGLLACVSKIPGGFAWGVVEEQSGKSLWSGEETTFTGARAAAETRLKAARDPG